MWGGDVERQNEATTQIKECVRRNLNVCDVSFQNSAVMKMRKILTAVMKMKSSPTASRTMTSHSRLRV